MAVSGSDRARWVERGETTHVSSFGLFSGMFYVGKTFGSEHYAHDKYILNPSLPIGRNGRDYVPGHDPFGCSYEQLPPSGRKAYLQWVSGWCRDTQIPVQFVRLYCGGFYYRVFVDKGGDRETLFAEARRLMVLHRGNAVFAGLLADLLAFGSGIDALSGVAPTYLDEWKGSVHVASAVVVRIASLIGSRSAVGPDDAFVYAMERAKVGGKKTVDVDGVKMLWRRLYSGRYPDGIMVDPPTQKLKLEIAMPDGIKSVRVPLPKWTAGLPDPKVATEFNERLDDMYAECVKEMEGYSRLVKRAPGAAGTLEAISVLPKQLVATSLAGRFSIVKTGLDNQMSKQGITVSSVKRLFEFMELPFKSDDEITPSVRKLISVAMDKMDIAFEPDARYGATPFSLAGSIVFFRGENGLPVEWDGAYAVHRACADFVIGHVCDAEQAAVAEKALFELRRKDVELDEADRVRLGAHARSLVRNHGVGKAPAFKQARLDQNDMADLARYVVAVVAAVPGVGIEGIGKAEKFLAKIGADRRDLHAALHRGQKPDADGLVSVVKAEPRGGRPIPAAPAAVKRPKTKPPAIDLGKLKEIENETVLVSDLLRDIFSEEAILGEAASAVDSGGAGVFRGLDVAHSDILAALMAAGETSRKDFEVLVRERRLMPDGVLETINDMAFDVFGEPVLVDNGNVIFEEHLRAELEKARVTP